MTRTVFPPRLKPGDTIGVVSPASTPKPDRLKAGIDYLTKKGYNIVTGSHVEKKTGYLAGSDRQRVTDLNEMISNPAIDAIICSRGGYGCARIVSDLDYDAIAQNPKPLVGYSDITTLNLALFARCHIVSYSGPMVAVEMGKGIHPFTEKWFWKVLNEPYPHTLKSDSGRVMQSGKAHGRLLGGCLALINHALHTPFCPDFAGAILFFEDIGEDLYRIDRYMAQLKNAGILDSIAGLLLGDFIDCQDSENTFVVQDIIERYTKDLHIPILTNFPYGHGDVKFTLPVGAMVELDADRKSLTLLKAGDLHA